MNDPQSPTTTRRAALAALLMAAGAGTAYALTPRHRLADLRPLKLNLNADIPRAFGDWRVDTASYAGIVNPETQELLDRLYNQQLLRTYIDSAGRRVMVSIVYGEDQRQRNHDERSDNGVQHSAFTQRLLRPGHAEVLEVEVRLGQRAPALDEGEDDHREQRAAGGHCCRRHQRTHHLVDDCRPVLGERSEHGVRREEHHAFEATDGRYSIGKVDIHVS